MDKGYGSGKWVVRILRHELGLTDAAHPKREDKEKRVNRRRKMVARKERKWGKSRRLLGGLEIVQSEKRRKTVERGEWWHKGCKHGSSLKAHNMGNP